MKFLSLLLGFYFVIQVGWSQSDLSHLKHVDAHVSSVSQKLIFQPDLLVSELTVPFQTDREKVRAIFVWIATNIEYNYTAYKNNIELYQNINEVMSTGKAMCFGFSLLFEEFCDRADLDCLIIEGYAKGLGYEEGQKLDKPNHAWNAVRIGNSWYLMDVTWASGTPRELAANQRVIDLESYFMTPPEDFIKTHLPQDPTWQLLKSKMTLEEFEDGPKVSEETERSIDHYSPADYSGLDEFDRDILYYRRSMEFNPEYIPFIEQLSFAYIYKANSLTDGIRAMQYYNLLNKAEKLEKEFLAYMDSAWQIIDPVSMIRIQKSKGIIRDEINYQHGVFHYEVAAELYNKCYNSKSPIMEIRDLANRYFSTASEHFAKVPNTSIYGGDAKEYLEIIRQYQARLKNR